MREELPSWRRFGKAPSHANNATGMFLEHSSNTLTSPSAASPMDVCKHPQAASRPSNCFLAAVAKPGLCSAACVVVGSPPPDKPPARFIYGGGQLLWDPRIVDRMEEIGKCMAARREGGKLACFFYLTLPNDRMCPPMIHFTQLPTTSHIGDLEL